MYFEFQKNKQHFVAGNPGKFSIFWHFFFPHYTDIKGNATGECVDLRSWTDIDGPVPHAFEQP